MSIPIEAVAKNWRGGEFPCSVDDLLRLRESEDLELEELELLEAQLLLMASHGVSMVPGLGIHLVEAVQGNDFEFYAVPAYSEQEACEVVQWSVGPGWTVSIVDDGKMRCKVGKCYVEMHSLRGER